MIYFDNAATTQLSEPAADVMREVAVNIFSNAFSAHTFGLKAERITEDSRAVIAKCAKVKSDELYFTPCGTLADSTAILGSLSSKRGGRIITTAFEHPAVLECFKMLEPIFDVVYITPDKDGNITAQNVSKELTKDTKLVSIMHVNNETGAISPLKEISQAIKQSGSEALFHTDAIQSFMKEDFNFETVDMASFSAHKNHGPKGLGALYVKKGIKLKAIYPGGGQEKGLFSTTTNTPAIAAWAKSCSMTDINADRQKVAQLNQLMCSQIVKLGGRIISPQNGTPYIISAVFEHYLASNILNFLSEREIYLSQGSACSSKHGSHVFRAIGLEQYQKNAVRISFCAHNTIEEVIRFSDTLSQALNLLLTE